MVCYFASWAVKRKGNYSFDVEDIDPHLCTHLMFAFAGLGSDNKIKVLDPPNDLCDNHGRCAFDRFTALKKNNTDLVTILAVGGWAEGSEQYSNMSKTPETRKTFIGSAIKLLKTHDFDGLDMDWEYPTQRGGVPEDKENFVLLLKELKEALHAEGMMLSTAVGAGKAIVDASYDIPGIAKHVDMVNLMTYDLHGSWDNFTHHHSGLYAHPNDTGDNVYFNQDFAVRYWIKNGMPASKLTQGVPVYGRCWTLDSMNNTNYYAPANEPGPGGLAYFQICQEIRNGWTVVNDPAVHEPYLYNQQRRWCSYDDPHSAKLKAQYAKEHNLAGMMVWSLDIDDFKGECGRKFDLIKTLVETFTTIIDPPAAAANTTKTSHQPSKVIPKDKL